MKQVRDKQISITLPKYIIAKVEKDAAKHELKRAGMLSKIIIDHYEKGSKSK